MRIYELVDDKTRRALCVLTKHQERPVKKKPKEKFSEKELKELMGVNRDRYYKVNGKVKRK